MLLKTQAGSLALLFALSSPAFAGPKDGIEKIVSSLNARCKPAGQSQMSGKICQGALGYQLREYSNDQGGLQLILGDARFELNPLILQAFGVEASKAGHIDVNPTIGWRAVKENGKKKPVSMTLDAGIEGSPSRRVIVLRLDGASACLVGSVETTAPKDQLEQRVKELAEGDAAKSNSCR